MPAPLMLAPLLPAWIGLLAVRAVPGPDATERWGVPVEPKGVPVAPIIGAGKATEADLTPTALVR